jgi:transposase InsO family protein
VCEALLQLFMQTGLSSSVTVITSDNASNFCAGLTREFMQSVGVSPRFSTPGHPEGNSLAERCIGSVKQNINSKVAFD